MARTRACSVDTLHDGSTETDEYTIAIDAAGRVVELQKTREHPSSDPDVGPSRSQLTITRSYDPGGRIVEETRREMTQLARFVRTNEKQTKWSRDAKGRIDHVEHIGSLFTGSTLTTREHVLVTVVKRDDSGRPSRVDRIARLQFWDAGGRPSAEDRVRRDEPFRERAYDDDGRVLVERWSDDARALTRTFIYEKQRVTHDLVAQEGPRPTGQRIITTYDERGRRVRRERFNLTATGPDAKPSFVEQLEYDDAGRIAATTMSDARGRSTFRYRGDCPTNLDALFEQRFVDSESPWWDELAPRCASSRTRATEPLALRLVPNECGE